MKRIVLIDECYPINTRNQRIIDSLASAYGEDAQLEVITWDRNNEYRKSLPRYHVYRKASAYGNRVKKFFNMWGFYRFSRSLVRELKPDVVIASHWNNLLMVPRLDHRTQMLVYENLDMPSGPFLIRTCTSMLEKLKMRDVDITVYASRFFAGQYSASFPHIVLENKPTFHVTPWSGRQLSVPIRVAFIGNLRYYDILKNLVAAVRGDSRFHLYFHGNGPAKEQLERLAEGAGNIFFTGHYAYEDVARLYEQTDLVWASYPNRDFNVKFAISNKFHESVMLGVPAIYSTCTALGEYAVRYNLGLEVDPYSVEAIRELLDQVARGIVNVDKMKKSLSDFSLQQTSWSEDFTALVDAINKFGK